MKKESDILNIDKLIQEARKTKSEKSIKKISNYYYNLFYLKCNKVNENVIYNLVKYYLFNDIKISLEEFLNSKRLEGLASRENFDHIIESEDKEEIKIYYINKMYNTMIDNQLTKVLSKNEIYELCNYYVNSIFCNYIKDEKKSDVSNYFNAIIYRQITFFKNEEKLLLFYARNIKVNENIKKYFCNKYKYLLNDYKFITMEDYEKCVCDILYSLKNKFDCSFENYLKKNFGKKKAYVFDEISKLRKKQPADIEMVRNYYMHIKDVIFDKFKDKITVDKSILKKEIDKKYDGYFYAAVNALKNNPKKSISRYINNRLTTYISNKKMLFRNSYIDDDIKSKINENITLIDSYIKRFSYNYPKDELEKKLKDKYFEYAYLYYEKEITSGFDSYVKGHILQEAKKITENYLDDDCNLTKHKHL